MEKYFKRDSLRDGMIVELRNGDRYLVLCKRFINYDTYISLGGYDPDLFMYKAYNSPEWDVMKVYLSKTMKSLTDMFDDEKISLLWERKSEAVELTLEDIAKKFEVDVDRIKIKK